MAFVVNGEAIGLAQDGKLHDAVEMGAEEGADIGKAAPWLRVLVQSVDGEECVHTGIVVAVKGIVLDTVEGNSNDDGSAEGYEVAKRQRTNREGLILWRWSN